MNCGAELQGKYCHVCGQEAINKTPSIGAFIAEYANHAYIWDSNFFKTIWDLISRPGYLTKEFIAGKFASHEHPLKLNMFLLFVFITLFALFAGTEKMNNSVHNLIQSEKVLPGFQLEFLLEDGEYAEKLKVSPRDTVQLMAPLFLAEKHHDFINCIETIEDTHGEGVDKWIATLPHALIEDSIILQDESGCYSFNENSNAGEKEIKILNTIWGEMVKLIARYFPLLVLFTAPFLSLSLGLVQRRSRHPRIHHFIFALHYTAFLEVLMMCIFLLHLTLPPPMDWMQWVLILGSCLYLTIAFRRVYETKTWIGAALKALFTSLVYMLIGLMVFFGILIVACFVAVQQNLIS